MLPVTSVIKLIDGMFEVPWVVLTEPEMLLAVTFFTAVGAENNNQSLTENLNMPEI